MKKPILLTPAVAVLAIALAACTEHDEPQPALEQGNPAADCMITVPDTTQTLSYDRAVAIASRFKGSAPELSRSGSRIVETVETISDDNGNPLIYVVNYANNRGFVLLSANKDYYPVLAENDEGRFVIPTDDSPSSLWLDQQKQILMSADNLPDDVKKEAASQWMSYNYERRNLNDALASRASTPEKPQVYYDSLLKWQRDPNIEVFLYEDYVQTLEYQNLSDQEKNAIRANMHYLGNSNYGTIESSTIVLRREIHNYFENQLTTTKWGQGNLRELNGMTFNHYVPNNGKLGCVTVAVGQVMRYHEFPASYPWSKMGDKYPTEETAAFLYELHNKIGNSDRFDTAQDALKSYGYSVTEKSHDDHAVLLQLSDGYPVCMFGKPSSLLGVATGSGHAWVCDGVRYGDSWLELRFMTIDYRPTTVSVPDLMVEAYVHKSITSYMTTRFHMNWGWYGENNGFFTDDNIEVTLDGEKKNYKHGRKDLFIKPNK